jgi:phosphoserine phosphatase RsbU/P
MLPRLPRNLRIALLVTFVCCAPQLKAAASAERGKGPGGPHLLLSEQPGTGSPLTSVRYHFGDDPDGKLGWADPGFDDQSWPIAEKVRWPVPAYNSDGFMWARARVTVPSDAAEPIALCLSQNTFAIADRVFVNGKEVGRQGSLPPNIEIILFPQDAVFNLPAGVAAPGKTLVVAFRVWYPPFVRTFGWFEGAGFILDGSRNLRLALDACKATTLLEWGPTLALNILIGIMGFGLLAFLRWTGTREILLCSAMLIVYPVFQLMHDLGVLGLLNLSFIVNSIIYYFLQAAGMAIMVEFAWGVHGLPAPSLKRLAQVALIVFSLGGLREQLATTPSAIDQLMTQAGMLSIAVFNTVIFAVNLWALFHRKRTRLIAAALALIPIASSMLWLGGGVGGTFGVIHIEYLDLAFFVSALALFIMLGQSGWQAWRARDELRVEFEAAREMQEQLVAPAHDVPGFTIESVYAPATQVGGDFFRVMPADDGSLLLVMGDVSGKGLKAAMTVSTIMGALQDYSSRSPAEVLAHLNRVLHGLRCAHRS